MPAELAALSASTAAERESAWSRFVTSYTPLLLRVARTVMHDHDAAMDAYTFVLGQLREDDLRRLLAYRATADCSFSTWLAVVARRLCLDHYRQKYGRVRTDAPEARDAQRERRRLADLVAVEVEPQLAATNPDPAAALEQAEIINAVQAALSGLAPRDQLLLRYRFDDDLPAREIARLMRFRSVFHVYRRVNALLASCRTALAQKGIRSTSG
ncbi:MAG TPA: sigma-70 family RNA polymerase sigma factor [Gemmatimonadaceae bacterium]|nr:sigma-70 family RNA polymerase sigma factor [Gemmatimonadaceae bacterium]